MYLDKIKIYLFLQISKFFILILFIFLSVAWLLQITRLFTITNFIHIEVFDIIILSIFLIPNLLTVIIPFILIFGLLLSFIKLNRDNELVAILTLGLGLNPLKNTLIVFSLIIIFIFTLFNFYFAPKVYEIYKTQEYELRNNINLNKMVFSNFLNINKTTILDFNKKEESFKNIFISFKDEKENIVYASQGNITSKDNKYNFQLKDGFKISIDKNNQIEKLEFLDYILKIQNKNMSDSKIVDKNTYTIFDDIKSENYLNISFKIADIFIIIFIIYFFYNNNLKNLNLKTGNIIFFSATSIVILILNQILKNSDITLLFYIFFIILSISISLIISYLKKYE